MDPTLRDLEKIPRWFDRLLRIMPVMLWAFRLPARWGPLRRMIQRSTGGRVGAISGLAGRGEYGEAARRAIELLEELRHQPSGRVFVTGQVYCWFVTQLATRSLAQADDPVVWDKLIALATDGVVPVGGYCAARAFLDFARWKLHTGEPDAAREFAEIASGADDTWAEPDFFLGWMRLVYGGGDPIEPLARAIRKDPAMLARIIDDPVCGKRPHMVHTLQRRAAEPIVHRPS